MARDKNHARTRRTRNPRQRFDSRRWRVEIEAGDFIDERAPGRDRYDRFGFRVN